MRRTILILLLWGFPVCFCVGEEIPEYSFAPSGNECFIVEDYGSEIVGSAERPEPVEPIYNPKTNGLGYFFWIVFTDDGYAWYNSEGGQDYLRMNGDDLSWVEDVDPDYWEEFKEKYPQYWNDVEGYFEQNPGAPNNPFRLSLADDIGAVMAMILMGIAYGVFVYRVRRE